ncbi:hypothetical protein HRJ35_14905 [Shewanella oneidensis MR-1]|nr:hypothetical protein [Shewanella oneidensis]MDX5995663.1 hypothetical protein [Shewanella oneidensis]MEE2026286.1 hypothetical protein [Shewanella oneidensis]QKG97170.1 hypothetical protein HRJ35_14905 [Shewanella oneidensis MR-1]
MAMYEVDFLFLGGPVDGKRLTMPVYDFENYPSFCDIPKNPEGLDWSEKVRYNRRVLITPRGYKHTIYFDSRLSEDEQTSLMYAWAENVANNPIP